jgi:hypothetical protein
MLIPVRGNAAADDELDDEYDIVEDPVPLEEAIAVPEALVAKAPLKGVSAEVVRSRLGAVPPPKPRLREAEAAAAAKRMEKLLEPAPIENVVIPALLLIVGLGLSFFEVMHGSENPVKSVGPATALVLTRASISMVLMVGAIFMATGAFEVSIAGSFQGSIFKLCAIAIAPAAIYDLCTWGFHDPVGGGAAGAFASLILYGLLFYFLLKLDLKDTSVCVIITWILISAVNYAVFRVQGEMNKSGDSWFF